MTAVGYLGVTTTRVETELSLLFPEGQTSKQQLLLDAFREGPLSRTILIGLAGDNADNLAEASKALAAEMQKTADFVYIKNGAPANSKREEDLLFRYRFLLSPKVERERFTTQGLRQALENRLQELTTPLSFLVKATLSADPTSEYWTVSKAWMPDSPPQLHHGAWMTDDGSKALLVAETKAAGFDLAKQDGIYNRIKQAYQSTISETPALGNIRLLLTGPAVFAVETERTVKTESSTLSLIALTLVVIFLFANFRSPIPIVLSLLPLISGLVAAVFAVNLTFGFIHGITLAFGATLIGVVVDYPIHLFSHLTVGDPIEINLKSIWPTMLLGAGTTAIGYSALWLSEFPGLAQLGLFAIIGILVAALVTRWVLPSLTPQSFHAKELFDLPIRFCRFVQWSRFVFPLLILIPVIFLGLSTRTLWETDVANLTPIPKGKKELDRKLRKAVGAPSVRDLIMIEGNTEQAALQRSETLTRDLDNLVTQGAMEGYDIATGYLPSLRVQVARQAELPDPENLKHSLEAALKGLPFKKNLFETFLIDASRARTQSPLTSEDFQGTTLGLKLRSLIIQQNEKWVSVVPLREVKNREAIIQWDKALDDPLVVYLDLKEESNRIVSTYRDETLTLVAWGALAICIVLALRIRAFWLFPTVILPIASSVVLVVALLHALGEQLSHFHLASLLLVLGLGLDYALFFNRTMKAPAEYRQTTLSISICCTTTILVFGTLAFSQIPVLRAIGLTAALGALISFFLSAMLSRHPLGQN